MKYLILGFMLLAGWVSAQQSDLIITGIMDGTLGNGHPKVIEVYALNDIPDLSIYAISTAKDGQGLAEPIYHFFPIYLKKGSFVYISSAQSGFISFFGWSSDEVSSSVDIDGNDAVALFKQGQQVDVFGLPSQNGTGTAWDYTDGWAYRKRASLPATSFRLQDWTFSGPNALDGQNQNATALKPFPIGSFSQIRMDGQLDASGIYGVPLCVQSNPSGFGDNDNPDTALANGSELNAVYGLIDGNHLCLLLTGNLESNFTKLEIFFDVAVGGQNRLLGNNPDVDFNGLNRMGDDGSGNGLQFDAGFAADYYLTISGGNDPYELYAYTAKVDNNGGYGDFLGGGVGTYHQLNNGSQIAINNSNTAGITGSIVQDPAAVTTGIELSIPLSALGNPEGDINITAFINGVFHDFVSNQLMCGLPNGLANLGDPREVNFQEIAGNQYVGLCSGIDAGILTFIDGKLEKIRCEGDGASDQLSFKNSSRSNANYAYIITDAQNIVQAIRTEANYDFEGTGIGESRIWGVSYLGSLRINVGDLLTQTDVSNSCYELTGNYLRVIKDVAKGGSISTLDGEQSLSSCRGDGQADVIYFSAEGTSNLAYTFLITDSKNRYIATASGEQKDNFDFEAALPDSTRVWGVSHAAALTPSVGNDIHNGSLSGGCYALSSNYLSIAGDEVEGSDVQLVNGGNQVILCADDANGQVLRFQHFSTSSHPYRFLITNTSNEIMALPSADSYDFSSLEAEQLRVWGLSYHGNFLAQMGGNVITTVFSDDCFELSANFISIERQAPQAGSIQYANGAFEVFSCTDNPDQQSISFVRQNHSAEHYAYVQTNSEDVVLRITEQNAFQLSELTKGLSYIRGIAFYGNLSFEVGDTLSQAQLAVECAQLSANTLQLTRDSVDGGSINSHGQTNLSSCSGDGSADLISLTHHSPSLAPYIYLLTDTNDQVIELIQGNNVEVEGKPVGSYRIWGLSHSGQLLASPGKRIHDSPLTDECFALSQNFIELEISDSIGCVITKLEEISAISWTLFPNPADDQLMIQGLTPEKHQTLSLYDPLGQLVFTIPKITSEQLHLSVTSFPAGIYTVLVKENSQTTYRRLVIQ